MKIKSLVIISLFAFMILSSLSFVSATLQINSPNQTDGKVYYNTSKILFNLSLDIGQRGLFYYNVYNTERPNSPSNWIKLCTGTNICSNLITLREGNNSLKLKVIDSVGNVSNKSLKDIIIDTKKPIIKSISPNSNSFVNDSTLFIIKYDEDNLDNITLYYGYNEESAKTNGTNLSSNCSSGKNKECNTTLSNLASYDGKTIIYWFEIKDLAGHVFKSRLNKINVDTSTPILQSSDENIDKNKVKFTFEIQELNFKDISYYESGTTQNKWNSLCSRLIAGTCTATKSFSLGLHTLKVRVLDKAGNSAQKDITFTIA